MTKSKTLQIPPNELEEGIMWVLDNVSEFVRDARLPLNQRRTIHVMLSLAGTGKSKFLEFLIRQDIEEREWLWDN